MESDSIDCMASSDVMDDDEIHHHQLSSSLSKTHSNNGNSNNSSLSSAVHPSTTSVHELLECPVCTNSMYPPIHQAFKSFGWGLPPILLSLLFANGPKAFLMALALTIGQSAIAFAFEKVSGKSQSKQKHKTRARKTKKYTSRHTVRNIKKEEQVHEGPKNKKGMKGYQSWVVDDQGTTSFGGWDELDGTEPTRTPSTMENGSKRTTKPKDRLSMNETESNEPLLLRLLIAVFPFLGSWTKLFW